MTKHKKRDYVKYFFERDGDVIREEKVDEFNVLLEHLASGLKKVMDDGTFVPANVKANQKGFIHAQSEFIKIIEYNFQGERILDLVRRRIEDRRERRRQTAVDKAKVGRARREGVVQEVAKERKIKISIKKVKAQAGADEAKQQEVEKEHELVKAQLVLDERVAELRDAGIPHVAGADADVNAGAEQAQERVADIDVVQNRANVVTHIEGVAQEEQPQEQMVENLERQEAQLEENVNEVVEEVVEVDLAVQQERAAVDREQEQAIEPVAQTVKVNIVKDSKRKIQWMNTSRELKDVLKQIGKSIGGEVEDEIGLNDMINRAVELEAQIETIGYDVETVGDKEAKILRRAVEQAKGRKNVRALLQKRSSELGIVVLEEKKQEVEAQITAVEIALREIKEPLVNDGLVLIGDIVPPASLNANLLVDGLDEISEEIKTSGLSEETIQRIARLIHIMSYTTQQAVSDVLTNTLGELSIFNLPVVADVGARVLTSTLVRLLSRVVYYQTSETEEQASVRVSYFISDGYRQQDRNEGVVNRLLNALKSALPEPAPIPATPERIVGAVRSLAEQFADRQKKRHRKRHKTVKTRNEKLKVVIKQIENDPTEGVSDDEIQSIIDEIYADERDPKHEQERKLNRDIHDMEEGTPTEDQVNMISSFARAAATATIAPPQATTVLGESFRFENIFEQFIKETPNLISNQDDIEPLARIGADVAVPILNAGRGVGRGVGRGGQRIPLPLIIAGIATTIGVVLHSYFSGAEPVEDEGPPVEDEGPPLPVESGKIPKDHEEITQPGGGDAGAIGRPDLRAEFNMLGIDYFNDQFALTPKDVENSEWAEYNYVDNFDRQNNIEIDNEYGELIRFQQPLFLPKYNAPPAPPSQIALIMTRSKMTPAIQLSQGFAPKFDGAITTYNDLSYQMNNDEFARGWENNVLYHPDSSIM